MSFIIVRSPRNQPLLLVLGAASGYLDCGLDVDIATCHWLRKQIGTARQDNNQIRETVQCQAVGFVRPWRGGFAPSIHVIPEGRVAGDGSYAEDTKEAERRESRTKKRKTKKKPAGFGP